jgi:hypothetical protein
MTPQTRQLYETLSTLERGLGELRRWVDTIVNVLKTAEQLLLIPKVVSEKLDLLDKALLALLAVLTALSAVPYIGPVAKALAEVVKPIQRMVNRASTHAAKIEARVKPLREQVSKLRDAFERFAAPLRRLDEFVGHEVRMLELTATSTDRLPDSRYKQCNLDKLDGFSAQLLPATSIALTLVQDSIANLRAVDGAMRTINSLCEEIQTFIAPIVAANGALDRQTKQISGVNDVLQQRVGPFTVAEALGILNRLPQALADQAKSLVKPFLDKMRSLPGIPPVLQLVPLLSNVADTLQSSNRVAETVRVALDSLTGERDLQQAFASERP